MATGKDKETRARDDENRRALELIEKSKILNPDTKLGELMKLTRDLPPITGVGANKEYHWCYITPHYVYFGTVDIPDKKPD